MSVGFFLELRRAAHLLGRITERCVGACIVGPLHFTRQCLSVPNLLGGVAGTVTGLLRPGACPGHAGAVPFGSLVVVAPARWNRHTNQHRSTADTTRRARAGRGRFPLLASAVRLTRRDV